MWWQDAVVYQIYPRSFQDSDGDGVGDLPGVLARLDHVQALGVDAIWLSPFYPSPDADYGYDVADYTAVDPRYGTLEDFDRLVADVHGRGLKVLVDFVPCHTSIEHPWFRRRPEFYFWADEPANNWLATFGGPAWQHDMKTGRYYLHSFYPEQADLNWRNPDVVAAMTDALRFWRDRGVDGFRLDAIDRVLKDPQLRDDPPAHEPFGLPLPDEYAHLRHVRSMDVEDIATALGAIRGAVGDALLVGEAYLPTARLSPYLQVLDVAFAFEPMNAGPVAERLRATVTEAIELGHVAWVLSNHDFPRLASRFGENFRAAAVLFMALPGPVFVYQGDEIAMPNGPGADPPLDRGGRDAFRHPMQWDGSEHAGFSNAAPWLPIIDAQARNVHDQRADPDSVLALFARLIDLRRQLQGGVRFLASPPGTVVLERGAHTVALNLNPTDVELEPPAGELVLEARAGDGADPRRLPSHGACVTQARFERAA